MLDPEAQLKLLAYTRDPAAIAAVQPEQSPPEELRHWILGLLRFKRLGSRAACIAALSAERCSGRPLTDEMRGAREGAVAWINCPCKLHGEEALRASSGVEVQHLYAIVSAVRRRRRQCVEDAWRAIEIATAYHAPTTMIEEVSAAITADLRQWIRGGESRLPGS